MGFETFIFSRYLKSRRKDRSISVITAISTIGVSVGVMALIVSLSVMNGFEKDLQDSLQGINGHILVYSVTPAGFRWDEKRELENKVKKTVDIEALAPFTQNQALIMGGDKPKGTLVKGIDPRPETTVSPLHYMIRTERFEVKRGKDIRSAKEAVGRVDEVLSKLSPHLERVVDKSGSVRSVKVSGIIVGSRLASSLGVEVGDWVRLISPEERITPMGNMPRAKRFRVVGFFESGIMGYDEVYSMIHIEMAQKIFRLHDRITGATIKIADASKANDYKDILQREISLPYLFSSWQEQNKNLFAVIKLEKLGLAIILYCIILIAGVSIISSLIMLVIEKTKDIAILKTMGATDTSILKIFVLQGTAIGIAGTVIGIALGLLVCFLVGQFDIIDIPPGVYAGNRIPMHIDPFQVMLISMIAIAICFFVTILPSRNAAKMDPVMGLKND